MLKIREYRNALQVLNIQVHYVNNFIDTGNIHAGTENSNSNDGETHSLKLDVLIYDKNTDKTHIVTVPIKDTENKHRIKLAVIRALYWYLISHWNLKDLEYVCSDEIDFMYVSTIGYWKKLGLIVFPPPRLRSNV